MGQGWPGHFLGLMDLEFRLFQPEWFGDSRSSQVHPAAPTLPLGRSLGCTRLFPLFWGRQGRRKRRGRKTRRRRKRKGRRNGLIPKSPCYHHGMSPGHTSTCPCDPGRTQEPPGWGWTRNSAPGELNPNPTGVQGCGHSAISLHLWGIPHCGTCLPPGSPNLSLPLEPSSRSEQRSSLPAAVKLQLYCSSCSFTAPAKSWAAPKPLSGQSLSLGDGKKTPKVICLQQSHQLLSCS